MLGDNFVSADASCIDLLTQLSTAASNTMPYGIKHLNLQHQTMQLVAVTVTCSINSCASL